VTSTATTIENLVTHSWNTVVTTKQQFKTLLIMQKST